MFRYILGILIGEMINTYGSKLWYFTANTIRMDRMIQVKKILI